MTDYEKGTFAYNQNQRANKNAWKKLTEAERLTGRTAEQLAAEQAEMKAAALKRLGKDQSGDISLTGMNRLWNPLEAGLAEEADS